MNETTDQQDKTLKDALKEIECLKAKLEKAQSRVDTYQRWCDEEREKKSALLGDIKAVQRMLGVLVGKWDKD